MTSLRAESGWRFALDRGGTFTDVVASGPGGARVTRKVLSARAGGGDPGLEAIAAILREYGAAWEAVEEVRIGTTVATNALLERQGARVAFVVTEGFADALEIGVQARPEIFARHIVKPSLLYDRVIEARERMSVEGEVLTPLDEARLRTDLAAARADGVQAVAIACVHGWAHPAHERRIADIARALGFAQVSVASELSGLRKFIGRADTTVADAYLSPVLRAYVSQFAGAFAATTRVSCMQSNGGLVDAATFRGRDAVLSGPAGGIVGMAAAARAAGFARALGFDMGGTSTDVSHVAGAFERTHDTVVAGVRLTAPMLQVHTVAAGGGSVCFFDGARLRVGPRSAGADPGPASYRRGGPLTLTDCNVLLGRVRPDYFPAIFGARGDEPLDMDAVAARFVEVCGEVERATGHALAPEDAAEGFLAIANEHMAAAIKQISIQRGYDPREYVLCAFGGAGGQHACAVADAVGVEAILVHPDAAVLSAVGIAQASVRAVREVTIEAELAGAALAARAEALAVEARAEVARQGVDDASIAVTLHAHVKYAGTDVSLPIAFDTDRPAAELAAAFADEHRRRFGFDDPARGVIVAALSAEASSRDAEFAAAAAPRGSVPAPLAVTPLRFAGASHSTRIFARDTLPAGFAADGPLLIVERGATTVVEPGWHARITDRADLILERRVPRAVAPLTHTAVDPVHLEIFHNRFMGIAQEMGLALQATASSVNIKERLDFSCALFDASGGLVANAPHIPVHLGSMSDSVRAILARRGDGRDIRRGDVYMLNAPHAGGTHLPDITVIAPVFLDGDTQPAFFTAARGHHGDIGGLTPGSMPPHSTTLADEGVLLDNVLLLDEGRWREPEIRTLFAAGPHPARDIDRNLADLRAQVAACARGAAEMQRLVAQHGRDGVAAYMQHVQRHAEECVRRVIARLTPGEFAAPMDKGAVIRVAVRPDRAQRSAVIDFTGTSAQDTGNFNAPLAVTRAAVLYVFRTLVDDAIPLNEGCLAPLTLVVPPGSLLNPAPGAAVVAGNVETSQVIVDALYGALGALAASQGTMNNFTFGDARHQYYETIAGGSGAGPGFEGASAVQTHMTNSRLTDPEVLEARFPVMLESFAVRRGSGGAGATRGGDGAVRRVRFRAPMTASILANRRVTVPFGLAGGEAGRAGATRVERTDGRVEHLAATASVQVERGDCIVIETPGGGGFGPPSPAKEG